ncbi:hypothetical protein V8F20_003184 [Naviculisporaceae sp. PSN 640]
MLGETNPSLSPVIVTGGCGFIGSHLVDGILEREPSCEIHVLDIKLTNTGSMSLPNVTYHKVDITSLSPVTAIFQRVKPKTVFHVATAPALSTNKSLLQSVIVTGSRNLLQASQETPSVKAFIYTSSSSVVHDNKSDLIDADESWPVLEYPRQKKLYTLYKAEMEKEILAANGKEGVLTVSIRPSSNFGPRDYTMMGKVVENVRRGKGHYQIGKGQNRYSFTYVANTVDVQLLAAWALLGGSEEQKNRVSGQAFNVTNDEDVLFWDFQRAIAASVGMPIRKEDIVVIPLWVAVVVAWLAEWLTWVLTLGKGETKVTWEAMYYAAHHRTLKCDKAKRILGYRPRVSIKEGLEIAGRWFVEEDERRTGKKSE